MSARRDYTHELAPTQALLILFTSHHTTQKLIDTIAEIEGVVEGIPSIASPAAARAPPFRQNSFPLGF